MKLGGQLDETTEFENDVAAEMTRNEGEFYLKVREMKRTIKTERIYF